MNTQEDRFGIGDEIVYRGFDFKGPPVKLVSKSDMVKGLYFSETGSVHLVNALAYRKCEENEYNNYNNKKI